MTLKDLIPTPQYSKKVIAKLEHPRNCGTLAPKPDFPLYQAVLAENGFKIALYIVVDASDGVIADCKFQAIAPPLLIACLDSACDLMVRKNYAQARRITSDLILKGLDETDVDCTAVLKLIEMTLASCDLLPATVATPIMTTEQTQMIANWDELPHKEKLALIEGVINEEIRPYIELDEGGIEVLELLNNRELIINYTGACTSCHSSVGSTLSSIQQILQSKIHPEIVVVPNMTLV